MKGILIRLADTDSEAAAALKVIDYFDALVDQPSVDLSALATATALLVGCPVSIQQQSGEIAHSTLSGDPKAAALSGVSVRSSHGHVVWFERTEPAESTDALILERCAIAADLISERIARRGPAGSLDDPGLLEVLVRRDGPEAARRAAGARLGLKELHRVRLVALDVNNTDDRAAALLMLIARAGRTIRPLNVSVLDGIGAALVQETGGDSLAGGIQTALHERYGPKDSPLRCGISAAVRLDAAADAWDQARVALKFSIWGTAEQAVTTYEGLGPLSLLGELPRDRLEAHPDVVSLQYLERGSSGGSDLKVLDVFCHSSSLRAAAQSLHMHHSSVAARLEQIEQALGWALDTPEGRFRTRLAILAHRLVVGN
jgi:hypothetical protein